MWMPFARRVESSSFSILKSFHRDSKGFSGSRRGDSPTVPIAISFENRGFYSETGNFADLNSTQRSAVGGSPGHSS